MKMRPKTFYISMSKLHSIVSKQKDFKRFKLFSDGLSLVYTINLLIEINLYTPLVSHTFSFFTAKSKEELNHYLHTEYDFISLSKLFGAFLGNRFLRKAIRKTQKLFVDRNRKKNQKYVKVLHRTKQKQDKNSIKIWRIFFKQIRFICYFIYSENGLSFNHTFTQITSIQKGIHNGVSNERC